MSVKKFFVDLEQVTIKTCLDWYNEIKKFREMGDKYFETALSEKFFDKETFIRLYRSLKDNNHVDNAVANKQQHLSGDNRVDTDAVNKQKPSSEVIIRDKKEFEAKTQKVNDLKVLLTEIIPLSKSEPVRLIDRKKYLWHISEDFGETNLWIYQDAIYGVNGLYTEEQQKLLVHKHVDKERQKFERLARAFLEDSDKKDKHSRSSIPEETRIAVWRRDQGKCVKCGNRENLEYDHIIPISKGGSNTARNIELLCQNCNRAKSNHIE